MGSTIQKLTKIEEIVETPYRSIQEIPVLTIDKEVKTIQELTTPQAQPEKSSSFWSKGSTPTQQIEPSKNILFVPLSLQSPAPKGQFLLQNLAQSLKKQLENEKDLQIICIPQNNNGAQPPSFAQIKNYYLDTLKIPCTSMLARQDVNGKHQTDLIKYLKKNSSLFDNTLKTGIDMKGTISAFHYKGDEDYIEYFNSQAFADKIKSEVQ